MKENNLVDETLITNKINKKIFLIKDEKLLEIMSQIEEMENFPLTLRLIPRSTSSQTRWHFPTFKIGEAYYIPINHTTGKNLDENKFLKFKPVLEDETIKDWSKYVFDYILFFHRNIKITSMEDTMLMSYVLDAGKNRHNMDDDKIHLQYETIPFKDLVGSGKKQITFDQVDIDLAKNYVEDADIVYRLFKNLQNKLKKKNWYTSMKLLENP